MIALSGDVGFYSGAKKLLDVLNGRKPEGVLADDFEGQEGSEKENGCVSIEIICGISSVVYFMSQIGLSWDDAKITSTHGKNCNLVSMIKQNQKVFSILGTGSAVAELAQKLVEYEMGDVVLYVGENLSYPDEKIFQANASELTSYEGQALSVVCA